MITSLKINGFKSIYDEVINLKVINVFIGANGCGKSNILEALGVISAAAFGLELYMWLVNLLLAC